MMLHLCEHRFIFSFNRNSYIHEYIAFLILGFFFKDKTENFPTTIVITTIKNLKNVRHNDKIPHTLGEKKPFETKFERRISSSTV